MPGIKEIEEIWIARQPIIWVNTFEERRVIEEIVHSPIVGITKEEGDEIGKINPRKKLFMWSCTQGLVEIKGDQFQNFDTLKTADMQTLQPVVAMEQVAADRLNYETHDGSILIMRDLHKLMNIPMPARKMRDIIKHLSITMKTIFIVGPSNEIPDELQKDIYYVDFDYPDAALIRNILDVIVGGIKKKAKVDKKDERFHIARARGKDMRYRTTYSEEEISDIVKSAQGLTRSEITIAFSKSINNTPNGEIEYLRVAEEKKNIIKRSQVLEIWTRTEPMKDVGGNGELKTWLEERGNAVTGKASDFGVRPPKGALVTGVQGGGKSMIAKAVAGTYRLPLIRLDFGRIFAGLVGSSEKNTRNMISQVEAMAPCVIGSTEITLATGAKISAKELWELSERGIKPNLMGYDDRKNEIVSMKLHHVIRRPAQDKKLLEVITDDGMTIIVTENHQFLTRTVNGPVLKEAKDLTGHDDIMRIKDI